MQVSNYDRGLGASFTSTSIPKVSGGKATCALPLGFILTPMSRHTTISNNTNSTHTNPHHHHPNGDAPLASTAENANDNDNNQKPPDTNTTTTTMGPIHSESDMQFCTNCHSYLNKYCDYTPIPSTTTSAAKTVVRWTCSICHSPDNVAPIEAFSGGSSYNSIMGSSVVEYRQPVALSSSGGRVIVIVLDGNISRNEAHCIVKQLEMIYNKTTTTTNDDNDDIRFGLVIYTSVINVYQVGLMGIASADLYHPNKSKPPTPPPDEKGNHHAATTINEFDRVGLDDSKDRMVVGKWEGVRRCVNAYFGIDEVGDDDDDDPQRRRQDTSTDDGKLMSRSDMMKLKREVRLQKKKQENSNDDDRRPRRQRVVLNDLMMSNGTTKWQGRQTELKTTRQYRCTGEAVAYASYIASKYEYTTGRLLVFTNGCPNVGGGSVVSGNNSPDYEQTSSSSTSCSRDIIDPSQMEAASHYLNLVGKGAFDSGIGVDVFCGGVGTTFGTPALLTLVKPSGGYVLRHSSFRDDEQFCSNVEFVLTQTHMSRARVVGDHAAKGNNQKEINGCVLDLRMPSNVSPTHITGPGHVKPNKRLELLPNEWPAIQKCYTQNSNNQSTDTPHPNLARIVMGRYDPLSTISVMMQVTDGISHEKTNNGMCFQFVVRFVNPQNSAEFVTRVLSHKLETSYDVGDFIKSTVEDVVPIVLGREAVDRTYLIGQDNHDDTGDGVITKKYTKGMLDQEALSSEARKDLDTTVYRISKEYRQSFPDTDSNFPPMFEGALKKLHNFRRGVNIGPNIQSVDDMAILRDLFLRLPLDDSICMLAPIMRSFSSNEDGKEVPPDTLALLDDCVIAADNHDSMFIWQGKDPSLDELLQTNGTEWLRARSSNRFPAPTLHKFSKGDSMERRLLTRLSPHEDDNKFCLYYHSSDKNYTRWENSIVKGDPPPGISLVEHRK